MVYRYVLTSEHGLTVSTSGGRARLSPMSTKVPFRDEEDEEQPTNASPWMLDTGAHANQMRYVCRQLREETTGLEIRFNKVTFFDVGYGHATRRPFCRDLIDFGYICAPIYLRKIKHVTICDIDGKSYDASRFQLGMDPVMNAIIVSLCRNYPSTTVTIESWPYPTLADTFILSKHLGNAWPLPESDILEEDAHDFGPPSITVYPRNLRFAFRHPSYPGSLQYELETYHEDEEDYANLLEIANSMYAEGLSAGDE
jgi:hypothetical protein